MNDEKWHGTVNGYTYHKCRCYSCKESQRIAVNSWRKNNIDKANNISRKSYRKNNPIIKKRKPTEDNFWRQVKKTEDC